MEDNAFAASSMAQRDEEIPSNIQIPSYKDVFGSTCSRETSITQQLELREAMQTIYSSQGLLEYSRKLSQKGLADLAGEAYQMGIAHTQDAYSILNKLDFIDSYYPSLKPYAYRRAIYLIKDLDTARSVLDKLRQDKEVILKKDKDLLKLFPEIPKQILLWIKDTPLNQLANISQRAHNEFGIPYDDLKKALYRRPKAVELIDNLSQTPMPLVADLVKNLETATHYRPGEIIKEAHELMNQILEYKKFKDTLTYFKMFYDQKPGLEQLQAQKQDVFEFFRAELDETLDDLNATQSLDYLKIYTYKNGITGTRTQFIGEDLPTITKLIEQAGKEGETFAEQYINLTPKEDNDPGLKELSKEPGVHP
ncbi:MAG: hypothetical protein K0M45_02335 [Candidatus Paracaedibacteraceae bacterium]|nr:hypothetical protein [Candidatus Paracaedibacteraceae bacterium]